jgi:hypothetical protein
VSRPRTACPETSAFEPTPLPFMNSPLPDSSSVHERSGSVHERSTFSGGPPPYTRARGLAEKCKMKHARCSRLNEKPRSGFPGSPCPVTSHPFGKGVSPCSQSASIKNARNSTLPTKSHSNSFHHLLCPLLSLNIQARSLLTDFTFHKPLIYRVLTVSNLNKEKILPTLHLNSSPFVKLVSTIPVASSISSLLACLVSFTKGPSFRLTINFPPIFFE